MVKKRLLPLICMTGLLLTLSIAESREDWPYDLYTGDLDATTVHNLSPREQRLLMEADHPGLQSWKQWQIKEQHPDTKAVITCKAWWSSECREFSSVDEYQRFRLQAYQNRDRRFFNYKSRQLQRRQFQRSTQPETIQPRTYPAAQQTESYATWQQPEPMTGYEAVSPLQVNSASGGGRIDGGNQFSHPLQ
jgi:hypothetical protein